MSHHLSSPAEGPQGNRHPEFGLPAALLIDGELYEYSAYLDCWVSGLGHELTGWTILHGMSTDLKVEVVR